MEILGHSKTTWSVLEILPSPPQPTCEGHQTTQGGVSCTCHALLEHTSADV